MLKQKRKKRGTKAKREGKTMSIELRTSRIEFGAGRAQVPGEIIEVPVADGQRMIEAGQAVEVKSERAPALAGTETR